MNNLKLVCPDITQIKSSFEAISSIVSEVQIKVSSDEGLTLDALDKSHITLIHFNLKPDYFDEFECPEPLKLDVDADEFYKIMKRGKSDDIMILSADEGNLIIIYEGLSGHERKFKTRLIEIYGEMPAPPEIPYVNDEITVNTKLLKQSVEDMELVGDRVVMKVDEDNFRMESEGDYGDAFMKVLHGKKIEQEVKSVFSLEKIKEMTKADKFSDISKLYIGNDLPIKWIMPLPKDEGELSFILAPRKEQEDDE